MCCTLKCQIWLGTGGRPARQLPLPPTWSTTRLVESSRTTTQPVSSHIVCDPSGSFLPFFRRDCQWQQRQTTGLSLSTLEVLNMTGLLAKKSLQEAQPSGPYDCHPAVHLPSPTFPRPYRLSLLSPLPRNTHVIFPFLSSTTHTRCFSHPTPHVPRTSDLLSRLLSPRRK